jgi:GNAT superfamily N-acetyltransferase
MSPTKAKRCWAFLSFHTLLLFHTTGKAGRVTALVVGMEHRHRGIARALLAAAEAFAWEAGCVRIEVTSGDRRDGADAFYESAGYRPDERRFIKAANGTG